jgi:hypothetical protein
MQLFCLSKVAMASVYGSRQATVGGMMIQGWLSVPVYRCVMSTEVCCIATEMHDGCSGCGCNS